MKPLRLPALLAVATLASAHATDIPNVEWSRTLTGPGTGTTDLFLTHTAADADGNAIVAGGRRDYLKRCASCAARSFH